GVNKYAVQEPLEIPLLEMDPEGERKHLDRLNRVRRERDQERVAEALEALRVAAQGDQNLMYPVLDCVRAYATMGEICDVLREVFGIYREVLVV
ncbi:MAG TPA: methylmalonyl-CoA mutase family protein, partial [Herpetosiphonaceae bacterium]